MKKSILEFETFKEILEFLKKHENIKIEVSRSINYGHGFCQLVDDKEGEGGRKSREFIGKRTIEELENMVAQSGNELYRILPDEDYDLNKPVYDCKIEEWANGYTSKATLIKILEKAKESSWWPEDDYDDEELSSIDTFINDSASSGEAGESDSLPEAWMKYLDAFDVTGGVSNEKGKEISWGGYWFLEDEEWDIILIT